MIGCIVAERQCAQTISTINDRTLLILGSCPDTPCVTTTRDARQLASAGRGDQIPTLCVELGACICDHP